MMQLCSFQHFEISPYVMPDFYVLLAFKLVGHWSNSLCHNNIIICIHCIVYAEGQQKTTYEWHTM